MHIKLQHINQAVVICHAHLTRLFDVKKKGTISPFSALPVFYLYVYINVLFRNVVGTAMFFLALCDNDVVVLLCCW